MLFLGQKIDISLLNEKSEDIHHKVPCQMSEPLYAQPITLLEQRAPISAITQT